MAMTKTQSPQPKWMAPRWPDELPASGTLRAVYGEAADELTIRFPHTPNRDIVVLWLATPRIEYAGLMVHEHSGMVVGVQIDYLARYTGDRHPDWRKATEPKVQAAVAAAIVKDVRTLFDHYGLQNASP